MAGPLGKVGLRLKPAAACTRTKRDEPLILSNMRQGACLRVNKLRLYQKGKDLKLKETDFFLSGTITRVEDEFYCEFRADFGPQIPRSAHFAINGDNSRLQPLVQNGIPLEHSPLKLKPLANAEIVELLILTNGSTDIPGELYAVIRNTERNTQNGDDTNPTLPLVTPVPACPPSLDLEQTIALGQALKASSHPHLQMLGGLLEAKILDERRIFFGQLVKRRAGLRLIEAAARIICLYNPMMGFENLDLNDPPSAFLAVFHPQTPVPIQYCNFANAFEKARGTPEEIWTSITKSALLVLLKCEEGRRSLKELADHYSLSDDQFIYKLLQDLLAWGRRKVGAPVLEPSPPAADCLAAISGQNENEAIKAALEFLRFYGFIRISDLLY
jgi:hypothetical protein